MATLVQTGFTVENLGQIDYLEGLQRQRDLHQQILEGRAPSTLMLLEHPSVYTAGRRTAIHERPVNGVPVIDVDRGGKITWHGPGQLVGYPIVKLKEPTKVVDFVRTLERALIATLKRFDIEGIQICENSGVWIDDPNGRRKIAAIGIRVAKGIVTHGFALNVNPNLAYFEEIIPCGIPDVVTTSIESELISRGQAGVTVADVLPVLEEEMARELTEVIA
jgi:lipoyl(octanoyl) transferase